MLLDRIDMVIRERSDLGNTKDPSGILEHLRQFYQEKDEDVADGFSSNPSTCQKGCISKIIRTSLCWGEGKNVVDDNTNHRGARMVFLILNSIDILEELRMSMMIMTHLSRDFMKM